MLSLRELEQRVVAGILTEDSAPLLRCLVDRGAPAAERLAIYRGNCREGFLAGLRAGYPVLERLTGEPYFRQLVRDYQRECPSPSGNLYHAGEKLPAFLARRFAETPYDYFPHVAALEWTCQEVISAADHAPFDVTGLGALAPADYARLRFELHPAVRLVRYPYPIVTIWEQHQHDREPDRIDLAAGGEQAVVHRTGDGVAIARLPSAEFACLAELGAARSFGAAIDRALAIDPAVDLPEALLRWTRRGFIAGFYVIGQSLHA